MYIKSIYHHISAAPQPLRGARPRCYPRCPPGGVPGARVSGERPGRPVGKMVMESDPTSPMVISDISDIYFTVISPVINHV